MPPSSPECPFHAIVPGEATASLDVLRGAHQDRYPLGRLVQAAGDTVPSIPIVPHTEEELWAARFMLLEENAKHKLERATTGNMLISDLWPTVRQLRADLTAQGSPVGIGQLVQDSSDAWKLLPITDIPSDEQDTPTLLHRYMSATMHEGVEQGVSHLRHIVPQHSVRGQRYARLQAILDREAAVGARIDASMERFVHEGINTSNGVIWGAIEVIPQVFQEQAKRRISGPELDAIATASEPFVQRLAAGHQERVISLLERLCVPDTLERPQYNHAYFTLDTSGPVPTLALKDRALARLVAGSDSAGSPTVGCAAGQAIISETYRWSLDVSRRYYFPLFPAEAGRSYHPKILAHLAGQAALRLVRRAF